MKIESIGPLRRMVFCNPETGKLYHGLGKEIELKASGNFTDLKRIYQYAYIPLIKRSKLI